VLTCGGLCGIHRDTNLGYSFLVGGMAQTRQFAWFDVAFRGEAGQLLCGIHRDTNLGYSFLVGGMAQTRQFAWFDVAFRGEAGQLFCVEQSVRSNSTKCAASGAHNFIHPRMMSQVGRVREIVCA